MTRCRARTFTLWTGTLLCALIASFASLSAWRRSDNGVAQQTSRRLGMLETSYRLCETDWSAGGANGG